MSAERFGIMLRTGQLAVHLPTDRPVLYAHASSARRAMARAPAWVTKWARVVPVTFYTAEEDHCGNGKETYVVHGRDPALDEPRAPGTTPRHVYDKEQRR